jgi:hypothetical protein
MSATIVASSLNLKDRAATRSARCVARDIASTYCLVNVVASGMRCETAETVRQYLHMCSSIPGCCLRKLTIAYTVGMDANRALSPEKLKFSDCWEGSPPETTFVDKRSCRGLSRCGCPALQIGSLSFTSSIALPDG